MADFGANARFIFSFLSGGELSPSVILHHAEHNEIARMVAHGKAAHVTKAIGLVDLAHFEKRGVGEGAAEAFVALIFHACSIARGAENRKFYFRFFSFFS